MNICGNNLFFSENVELGSKNFLKMIYDICLCKNWCNVNEQVTKELVDYSSILYFLYIISNLKYNVPKDMHFLFNFS